MIRHIFRPSILIALSAAVVLGAVVIVFQRPPAQGRPAPLPVLDTEREIVWLYPATNATSWERFVAAVRRTAERLQRDRSGLQADYSDAFPQQTTAVPEVSLSWEGPSPRFVFRWYKLTSDWKTGDWIEALLKRQPPPVAIIGGSSSDSARELASYLQHHAEELPEADRPLLLLTTATADRVVPYTDLEPSPSPNEHRMRRSEEGSEASIKLTQLYPGRTFRFCFTNQQMAAAVSNFIWSRDDLRPDRDPVYMAKWNDDSYSRDLIDGFSRALRETIARDLANQYLCHFPAASVVPMRKVIRRDLEDPKEWTPHAVFGVWPPGQGGGIVPVQRLPLYADEPNSGSTFRLDMPPPVQAVASSVGSFATPNPFEARVAGETLDAILDESQSRPLLVVAGQSQPSRRFLRGLIRGMPSLSRRVQIVVATGDTISFNTVYRDRQVAWNIQDLPFPLVFFCHRNPIDVEAGFRTDSGEKERDSTAETGTEDVLLFGDIVEALVQTAAPLEGMPAAHAAELGERLAEARLAGDSIVPGPAGIRLFNREGQRQSGTGEHVVCLKPMWHEDYKDRLLPRAIIEVWAWRRRDWSRGERGQHWERSGEPLTVWYNDRDPSRARGAAE